MTPKSSFSACRLPFVDFEGVLKLALGVATLELVELRYGVVADTVATELDVLEPWMGCACSVVEPERLPSQFASVEVYMFVAVAVGERRTRRRSHHSQLLERRQNTAATERKFRKLAPSEIARGDSSSQWYLP
jgi:hypothetical protein